MRFTPETLREYALLADGERGALVGPRGDVAFLCAPAWHDDAVFSGLLGGRGHFAVTPADVSYVWGGHYEDGTLIWRSRWVTTDGIVECREALAFPGDPDTVVLLRQLHAVRGRARARVALLAQAGFDSEPMRDLHADGEGRWTARTGDLGLRLSGLDAARPDDDGRLVDELVLDEGDHHDLVLEISRGPLGSPPGAPRLWTETEQAWARTVPGLHQTLTPRDARHSYAVLRGLTSRHGGMVAAAATSLPERAQEGRNYDYRYSWIRDQCYAGLAAAAVGGWELFDSAADFVAERVLADGAQLRPAYTIAGGPVPSERHIDLPGYPGGSDRVGNHARNQFQLDALGEALLLFAAAADAGRATSDHVAAAGIAQRVVSEKWNEPDAGIWELEERRWAHSRLQCAAGLRAMAAALPEQTDGWARQAERLVNTTWEESCHPEGRWQRAPDDDRVDASLLLPALRGALSADDPRTVKTWQAVRRELSEDGFVYRFRHDQRPLHEAEGAFVLCGLHMAMATLQQGYPVQAVRWFERNRGAVGPPGLFSEEYDVEQRQLRGNFPQAFVHALLLESSARLAQGLDDHEEPVGLSGRSGET